MLFQPIIVVFIMALSSLAAPLSLHAKRAAAAVLKTQTYNQLSVSSGVAGNALAEVNAKFPVRVRHLSHQTIDADISLD